MCIMRDRWALQVRVGLSEEPEGERVEEGLRVSAATHWRREPISCLEFCEWTATGHQRLWRESVSGRVEEDKR